MLRKIIYRVIGSIAFFGILSCESEYIAVNENTVKNDKFRVNHKVLPLKLQQRDINKIQGDNISLPIKKYVLGTYNEKPYKTVKASIVSQLIFFNKIATKQKSSNDIKDFKTKTNIDSVFTLDKVVLQIPIESKKNIKNSLNKKIAIQILQNKTFLNLLNPKNITAKNIYYTDCSYKTGQNLTENNIYEFKPDISDKYIFDRTKIVNDIAEKYKDTAYAYDTNKGKIKFVSVPLDINKMKALFWDKLQSPDFKDKESFQNHLQGIIIKTTDDTNSFIHLNFNSIYTSPRIKFFYTISRSEKGKFKDVLSKELRVNLGKITNAVYQLGSPTPITKGKVVVQGTAGSDVKLDLFTKETFNKLKSEKLLVNEATISFFIDQTNKKTINDTPNRLMLYKEVKSKDGTIIKEHISDAYLERDLFGGILKSEKDKPLKYSFKITNYINDLLNEKEKISSLVLTAYNKTADMARLDEKIKRTKVYNYNYNPKAVTLYDGSASNSSNKAQLKLLYSKEKTK